MKNKNNIFKPVKVKPLFSFKKPTAPVRLSQYPTRTKTEWKLIDRKPWSDSDRDRVPNIFDCKPLNRNRQAYIYLKKENKVPILTQETISSLKKLPKIKQKLMNEAVKNYNRERYNIPEVKEKVLKNQRKYRKNPEINAKKVEYDKLYNQRKDVKLKRRIEEIYNKRLLRQQRYSHRPEIKEKLKEYLGQPETKEKRKLYRKQWTKLPYVKEKRRIKYAKDRINVLAPQIEVEKEEKLKDMEHLNRIYDIPSIKEKIKERTGKEATYDEIVDEIYPAPSEDNSEALNTLSERYKTDEE